jgi:hypothetical protein
MSSINFDNYPNEEGSPGYHAAILNSIQCKSRVIALAQKAITALTRWLDRAKIEAPTADEAAMGRIYRRLYNARCAHVVGFYVGTAPWWARAGRRTRATVGADQPEPRDAPLSQWRNALSCDPIH